MIAPTMKCRLIATLVGGLLLASSPVVASERYALLVGISYENATKKKPPPGPTASTKAAPAKRDWGSLPGTGNDLDRMRATLLAVYGFSEKNVTVLRNAQATRAAILEALHAVLQKAKSGEHVLFFFAGHGSWVKNSSSTERDQRDETIVPADADAGVRDIRDKELRRLFNDAIDRGVLLTAIFDSCHSGSISRGASKKYVLRAADPDLTDIAPELRNEKPDPRPDPEARQGGAVVVSAAFEEVGARDGCELDGKVHGCFSAALFRAMRDDPYRPIEQIFASAQAILLGDANLQSPQIQGPLDRRRTPFFEQSRGPNGSTLVTVQRVAGDRRAVIGGGMINSVFPGAELVPADPTVELTTKLRLKVDSSDLATAVASIKSGKAEDISTGMMLRVDHWAMPDRQSLTVWFAPTKLGRAKLLEQVARLRADLGAAVRWTEDPTKDHPTHEIFWDGSAWHVIGANRLDRPIGPDLAAAPVRETLGTSASRPPKIFLNLPPTDADAAAIDAAAKPIELAFRRESGPSAAQYVLAGRPRASGGLEYAWLRRSAMDGDVLANPYPAVTDWETIGDSAELQTSTVRKGIIEVDRPGAEKLVELLRRLVVINAWLSADSPPSDGTFPYHLEIRDKEKSTFLRRGDVLRVERHYELVLHTDSAPQPVAGRRFVYVFTLDRNGKSSLLFPPASVGTSDNLFPYSPSGSEPLRDYTLGAGFKIGPPFGIDSYFLLTTTTPLQDPSILTFDGVQSGATKRGSGSPLDTVFGLLGSGRRGTTPVTPAGWHLERQNFQSVSE